MTQPLVCFAALLLLAGCATTGASRPTPSHYGFIKGGVDSPSATCANASISGCLALYGKEVASIATVGNAVKAVLDTPTREAIDEALKECANFARTEVLLRHAGDFEKPTPSARECNQPARNATRKDVTWAMQLGTEMHEEARKCAEERLGKLLPGKFSLEQRYRYDSNTGRKKLVNAEDERALEESGNGGELAGTLKPDVVIHSGDPLEVQAVYDFKFPCVNTDQAPRWNQYTGGPYQGATQETIYKEAFGEHVARVIPRWGVIR